MKFEASYQFVLDKIERIDPSAYARTRNYADGAITGLSPYISRGFISTKFVFDKLQEKGFKPGEMEKLLQELAWRDYWQQVWKSKGDLINSDLKRTQPDFEHCQLPSAVLNGETGIEVIDEHIKLLKSTGYIHNHMRMYIAALACNLGKSHWRLPAQWMYYHLLDGDWASNALSWQWVAGSNANKKYYANQENINRFFYSNQLNTFLDVDYSSFENPVLPEELKKTEVPILTTELPTAEALSIHPERPSLIYNYYNLDPEWHKGEDVNRILLLEPEVFASHPVSKKCIDFAMGLAECIPGIQLYVGSFENLMQEYSLKDVFYKEHPLNTSYRGTQEERDWMFTVEGYFPSFFAFWKKCKKEIGL